MKFDAPLVVGFLNELNKINYADEFTDKQLAEDFMTFSKHYKDEWDLSECDPNDIFEVMVLERIFLSRVLCGGIDESVASEFYYPYYDPTFFDPEPNPKLSISGWINHNYARAYEERDDHLPGITLNRVHDIIRDLVDASPTCDEMLTDHITEVYLESRDAGDDISRDEFFFGEGTDLIFKLYKLINKHLSSIDELINNSFEDELPNDLGRILINEISMSFMESFTGDYPDEVIKLHPLLLVKNQVEVLEDMLIRND